MNFAASFLREPDLFPRRSAGERWGDGELRVDVVGGPYRFAGLSEEQAAFLERHFRAVRLEGQGAEDVPIRAFRVGGDELLPIVEPGWELRMDLDADTDALRFASRGFFGRLDWRPALAASVWLPDGDGESWLGIFENALRLAAAYRLLERGGLLLHSAGVVAAGGAWVFVGRSGAGKSTLARTAAARGFEVLSDELNAIELRDGELVAERIPFSGDFGRDVRPRAMLPLAGLFALRQAPATRIEPLSSAAAAAELAACSPFVNADPARSERLLEVAGELARRARVRELGCTSDGSVWDTLVSIP